MALTQSTQLLVQPATPDDASQATRLSMKPEGPTTGYVDGAWWPRSRDLPAELQGLAAALAERLGRIDRVSYNLTSWEPTEHRTVAAGMIIRLQGYRLLHTNIVDLRGESGRVRLLVVSPDASPRAGNAALTMAGEAGNTMNIDGLLALE